MKSNCITFAIATIISLVTINAYSQVNSGYVYVDETSNRLKLNGKNHFVLSVNYLTSIARDANNNFYIAPFADYAPSYITCSTKTDCYNQVKADLRLIQDMGFNSIRLLGLDFGKSAKGNDLDASYSTWPYGFNTTLSGNFPKDLITEYVKSDYSDLKQYLSDFLSAVAEVNQERPNKPKLKVQYFVGGKSVNTTLRKKFLSYLKDVAYSFRNDTTLYSYDLYNEPLWFAGQDVSKGYVCSMVNSWHNAIKANAPNHLTTIGLTSFGEVNRWDPGFLNVDFLSYHPYPTPFAPLGQDFDKSVDRVLSEIKWYSSTSKKPWIIGETGFLANDDFPMYRAFNNNEPSQHGTEEDQKNYFLQTLNMTRDCGGSGYSAWQFQDEFWHFWKEEIDPVTGDTAYNAYQYDIFWGLLDHNKNPKIVVNSSNEVFKNFDPNINSALCNSLPNNYYNPHLHSDNFYVKGTITNQLGAPIKDAVVTSWSRNTDPSNYNEWAFSSSTFTDASGNFKLRSSHKINILLASGYGLSKFWRGYNKGVVDPQDFVNNFETINISLKEYFPDNIPANSNTTIQNGTLNFGSYVIDEVSENAFVQNYLITGNGSLGGSLQIKAGGSIFLNNGFKVEKGGHFDGTILNLNDYPNCMIGNNYLRSKLPQNTIENSSLETSISNIFPNPVTSELNVGNPSLIGQSYFIKNISGQTVKEGVLHQKIDVTELPEGVYFFNSTQEQKPFIQKFVKQ